MLLFRFDMAMAAYAGAPNHLTHGTLCLYTFTDLYGFRIS